MYSELHCTVLYIPLFQDEQDHISEPSGQTADGSGSPKYPLHLELNCTALYCNVLHWYVLHCTVLHCYALQCTVLHFNGLHCTVLHRNVLQCTLLHCNVLYCALFHNSLLQCTVLLCTAVYCNVLHCTSLPKNVISPFVNGSGNKYCCYYPHRLRDLVSPVCCIFFF